MRLALYQPEIPPNTGNAGRLCVGMDAELLIVGPCAFDLSDRRVRRAGLDYWPHLRWKYFPQPEDFLDSLGDRRPWLFTKKGRLRFDEPAYQPGDTLVMGNETRGLPPAWIERWADRTVHIPMLGPVRSYNLANSAAIVLAHAQLAAGAFDRAGTPRAEEPC